MRQATLSNPGKLYVSAVILAGSFAVAASIAEMLVTEVRYEWFILAALTVVSGSATVKLPSIPASLSVSETFVFTSVLLFGAPAGTLTVALDGLIISLWLNNQRKELHRVLFNMAAPAVSIWVAAQLFFLLAGITPLAQTAGSGTGGGTAIHAPGIAEFLVPLLLFTIAYFLLNSWLIALAVAFETGEAASAIWRKNFVWLSLNFLCGASVAALLTVYPREVNLAYIGAILPLLFVLYLTYKTSMARVEDANRHLSEINGMYISTIEALAMAVDAKDQVTHGHIRRVQAYAVGLAKALGIRDRGLIGAIEAASLLHDMGKLAIPEHILNKPGRLTEAEFEKMKLHASIGADILSSIHFPYPVIPIVRHHHENWDGTGYPDSLSGTAIPVGARILAVVDCFDALTSDRPYRPRLSDEQALSILLERRGRMYDPLVVDTFIEVFRHIDIPEIDVNDTHNAIAHLARSTAEPLRNEPAGQDYPSSRTPAHAPASMLRASCCRSATSGRDRLSVIVSHIRRVIPADTALVHKLDAAEGALKVIHADGLYGTSLHGRLSGLGQGVTGWTAANAQPALNSSAVLEFGRGTADALQSCLAIPLFGGGAVIGTFSLYSTTLNAFSADDMRILAEVAGPLLAGAVLDGESEDHAETVEATAIEQLLSACLRSDPSYTCRVILIGGGESDSDRLRFALSLISDAELVVPIAQREMVCIITRSEEPPTPTLTSVSHRISSYGYTITSVRYPKDGISLEDIVNLDTGAEDNDSVSPRRQTRPAHLLPK